MNGCEECIVYEIRHNMLEAGECLGCGKKSLSWKQGEYGDPYMECSECRYPYSAMQICIANDDQ